MILQEHFIYNFLFELGLTLEYLCPLICLAKGLLNQKILCDLPHFCLSNSLSGNSSNTPLRGHTHSYHGTHILLARLCSQTGMLISGEPLCLLFGLAKASPQILGSRCCARWSENFQLLIHLDKVPLTVASRGARVQKEKLYKLDNSN